MFLLGLLSFCMFGFESDDINGRLSFTITLVLSIIAFQFVISGKLPDVPYLTLIDKYNLFVFIMILLLSLECVIVGWKETGYHHSSEVDKWFQVVYATVFIIGHTIFAVYSRRQQKLENSKIGSRKPPATMTIKAFSANDYEKDN